MDGAIRRENETLDAVSSHHLNQFSNNVKNIVKITPFTALSWPMHCHGPPIISKKYTHTHTRYIRSCSSQPHHYEKNTAP